MTLPGGPWISKPFVTPLLEQGASLRLRSFWAVFATVNILDWKL